MLSKDGGTVRSSPYARAGEGKTAGGGRAHGSHSGNLNIGAIRSTRGYEKRSS